jgi:hypothetical protein
MLQRRALSACFSVHSANALEENMRSEPAARLLEARIDELAGRVRSLETRLGEHSEHVGQKASAEAVSAQKRYLTVREAAVYLGVSVSMLNRWRCDLPGGPPYIKVGARILYDGTDLDRFAAARRRAPLQ